MLDSRIPYLRRGGTAPWVSCAAAQSGAGVRRDIQFLRGIAVLMVVLYHADLDWLPGGYLGVDIFFVLSGFLITSMILRDLEAGQFSFAAFYLRRARRLLPALYCTLALTSAGAYFFVTESQRPDLVAQLVGALTFSANLVLPTQSGYFASAAETKPLLHIWSLSLEEQYYFTLPLLLWMLPRRFWSAALMALAATSLAWCLWWVSVPDGLPPFLWRISESSRGEWAFFLFPTRAWELLAGSICARCTLRRPLPLFRLARPAALVAIAVAAAAGLDVAHPRVDALLVVLATSVLVLGSDDWLPRQRWARAIERVGDVSYSIYLLHWPIFVFVALGYAGLIPEPVRLALIPLSVVAGFIQYRFVEQPFRWGGHTRPGRAWAAFATGSVAMLALPAHMAFGVAPAEGPDYAVLRQPNHGLSDRCDTWIDKGLPSECRLGTNPRIAVLGDSYAMHLVQAVVAQYGAVLQITKNTCGPTAELAPVFKKYGPDWAQQCIAFNRAALTLLEHEPSVTHVVLSSSFLSYVSGGEGRLLHDGQLYAKDVALTANALLQTVEAIRDMGKVPILVSPPPRSGMNIGECLEREDAGLVLFTGGCEIPASAHRAYEPEVFALLDRMDASGLKVVRLDRHLCRNGKCNVRIGSVPLYRDQGHLSRVGSHALGDLLSFALEPIAAPTHQ